MTNTDCCHPGFIVAIDIGSQYQVIPGTEGIPSNQFLVTDESGNLALESPVEIATYFSWFGQGDDWFYQGVLAAPPTTVEVPIFEYEPLCNVADQWTRRTAVGTDTERPIPAQPETLFETYPTLRRMSAGENWQLLLNVESGLIVLSPLTLFWIDGDGQRSDSVSLNDGFTQAFLEFGFHPASSLKLRSLALMLKEAPDLNLAALIDTDKIFAALYQIDQWLQYYTRQDQPLAIDDAGIAHNSALPFKPDLPSQTATAAAQLHLIDACLRSFEVTQLPGYRERALLLAQGLLNHFYPDNIPVDPDVLWLPQWLLNTEPGLFAETTQERVVEFIDGVGQVDPNLTEPYQVYVGQLSGEGEQTNLAVGQTYSIQSWVDAMGVVQQPDMTMDAQVVEPEGTVFYTCPSDTRLIFPLYSVFVLGFI